MPFNEACPEGQDAADDERDHRQHDAPSTKPAPKGRMRRTPRTSLRAAAASFNEACPEGQDAALATDSSAIFSRSLQRSLPRRAGCGVAALPLWSGSTAFNEACPEGQDAAGADRRAGLIDGPSTKPAPKGRMRLLGGSRLIQRPISRTVREPVRATRSTVLAGTHSPPQTINIPRLALRADPAGFRRSLPVRATSGVAQPSTPP